jgi:hypothetical protein
VTAAIGVRAGGLGPNNEALAACESPVHTDGAFSCGVTGLRARKSATIGLDWLGDAAGQGDR